MVYTKLDLLAFCICGIWHLYRTVFYPLQLVIFLPLCFCAFGLFQQQSGELLFQSQLLQKLAWSGQAEIIPQAEEDQVYLTAEMWPVPSLSPAHLFSS